jgi:FkbM family methyltransferase
LSSFLLNLIPVQSLRKFVGEDFLSPIEQFALNGYENLLYEGINFDGHSSIIILGGYLGDSTENWHQKSNSVIYVYEPILEYYLILVDRFKHLPRIHLFNSAVSDFTGVQILKKDGEKTGSRSTSKEAVTVEVQDILNIIQQLNNRIRVLEINIEGGEYSVLSRIINSDLAKKIDVLQIQFHKFEIADELRRAEIRNKLLLTHENIFDYPWVWERWILR